MASGRSHVKVQETWTSSASGRSNGGSPTKASSSSGVALVLRGNTRIILMPSFFILLVVWGFGFYERQQGIIQFCYRDRFDFWSFEGVPCGSEDVAHTEIFFLRFWRSVIRFFHHGLGPFIGIRTVLAGRFWPRPRARRYRRPSAVRGRSRSIPH